MTEKMTFCRDKCFTKAVHTIETGVLIIPTPVKMTPCPFRLQLHTLYMGGILTGKITFCRDKCLTKVVHAMETGVLNINIKVLGELAELGGGLRRLKN